MDLQRRLLETLQVSHFGICLSRIVLSHRCHNSSCSGRGSPGSGAIVQYRSDCVQKESALLQRGLGADGCRTGQEHVKRCFLAVKNSSDSNMQCLLMVLMMTG